MIKSADDVENWLSNATPLLASQIKEATKQLAADEEYERYGPTIGETLEQLEKLAQASRSLAKHLIQLSPVGKAALRQASTTRRGVLSFQDRKFGRCKRVDRHELARGISFLLTVADAVEVAPDIIHNRNISEPKNGPGTGSDFGRSSDLRAVGYAQGFETVPFRSPKDKFAVRVIEALYEYDGPHMSARALGDFLDRLWSASGRTERVSWDRVVKSRARIAEKMRLVVLRRDAGRARAINRDTTS